MLRILNRILSKKLSVLSLLLIVFLPLLVFPTFSSADTIKIGLRAHLGIEESMRRWQKTAEYLSEQIPEHKFIMIPMIGLSDLMQETEKNQFDFVITNPSSYVEMELRFGASAILTLRNKRRGKPYTKFGAVIFTRKDNKEINEVKDLKGKKIIAVSERAFGGWRVVVRELLNQGFDIYKEAKKINYSVGIQQDVVSIVRLGNADVGVVRTDLLERMASDGLIKLKDFKIINKKSSKDFPFYHSTQLYPEWPFVKMRDTSSALSKKVALALLTVPKDHPAAIAGKYVGWTVPEDYQPVHNLMQDLKVGPYKHYHENPIEHFFEEYLAEIIVSMIILFLLGSLTIYIFTINRQLVSAKKEQDAILNDLEERVVLRTRDLMISKEQAEQANKAKTEFLSNMSHELRTPLNAILGFAQLLDYETEKQQLTKMGDNVNEILYAGEHLLQLINDVLDMARIEKGQFHFEMESVPVNEIIHEIIHLLETQANEGEITFTCETKVDDKTAIVADSRSIKQVLINLISNAIKYNHPNGRVDIKIELFETNYCKIRVIDNGDGIAIDLLKVIFDPFQRGTVRTDIEGTGVGLAITKTLVDAMDGKIGVESVLGEGSTFTLIFKLAN